MDSVVPLAPDDPAREKIAELRKNEASAEEIMAALDTYAVDAAYLVKALSPGHAKVLVTDALEHMIQIHLAEGTWALTGVKVNPEPITWLSGPLSGQQDD